jgi:hypothetical protein
MAEKHPSFQGGQMPARVIRREIPQPSDPSYRLIALSKNKVAIVDAIDYSWLMQWAWHAHSRSRKGCRQFYAMRKETNFSGRGPKQTNIWMHRLILDCKDGEFADHKNGDSLDNRRKNLRKCSTGQNARNAGPCSTNTSGFKGVHRTWNGKWAAVIRKSPDRIRIGTFPTPEQAARAYDAAAKRLHGEFAYLNFPE